MLRFFAPAVVSFALLACGDKASDDSGSAGTDGTDGIDCSTIAMTSVRVTLEAADGSLEPSMAVAVEYAVDGGAFQACFNNPETLDFVCGVEEPGSFVVRASAEGYASAEATAEVGSDECHVITEAVTLVLEPEPSGGR